MPKYTYDPKTIEAKWQAVWEERKTFRTPAGSQLTEKPRRYVLDMFPYPSGEGLHVGHPKSYTASDVIARMQRMQGYNVLHVMGWDAFGLPAERAAERENIHPALITKRNIANIRRQMKRIGLSYDWEREINTSQPDYYKWTQWIFLKLFDRGLAYTADVPVNWCPALGTVLSNEEVQDGRYIETGDIVERRLMRQWMLKITAYAERLLSDLDDLDWPEGIKEMQRNWIGKSEGAEIRFSIQGYDLSFAVFTTRPDTLFGATYCVFAPEHPLVKQIVAEAYKEAVYEYIEAARHKSDMQRTALNKEKTGVFSGAYAINPSSKEAIPIWIADYVLISYGTGVIMGVPGHDTRDHEFAKKHGLPIREVIGGGEKPVDEEAYVGDGFCVNSGFLNGLAVAEAKAKMIEWLEATNQGRREIQYSLRDWLFSRQRYWGEPIPIIHLEDGTMMRVPDEQLPVELPPIAEFKPTPDGLPPLARAGDEWLVVTLPDGRKGFRETNTMPQWAGSCWYYLRYADPHNRKEPWEPAAEKYWLPVDLYIGGVEHAVLHLLYARFWHKVLYDCGLVSTPEPFQKLFNQGMILAYSFQDEAGKFYYPHQVEERDGAWVVKETGQPVRTQLDKMSKSRLNVASLDDVVDDYGADALRLYELFIGPLSATGPWQTSGIEGISRFLNRLWRLILDENTGELNQRLTHAPGNSEPNLLKLLHKTIKGVTEDIESIDKMNTAVSKMMEFVNAALRAETVPIIIVKDFLRLLAPFAPHIAEELWERLGEAELIAYAQWPEYDVTLILDEKISIPIQINGKLRTVIRTEAGISKEELEKAALNDEVVKKLVDGKEIGRVVVVPGQIVNILISEG
jgi:leucyl-tRNA synthetase